MALAGFVLFVVCEASEADFQLNTCTGLALSLMIFLLLLLLCELLLCELLLYVLLLYGWLLCVVVCEASKADSPWNTCKYRPCHS